MIFDFNQCALFECLYNANFLKLLANFTKYLLLKNIRVVDSDYID